MALTSKHRLAHKYTERLMFSYELEGQGKCFAMGSAGSMETEEEEEEEDQGVRSGCQWCSTWLKLRMLMDTNGGGGSLLQSPSFPVGCVAHQELHGHCAYVARHCLSLSLLTVPLHCLVATALVL